MSQTFLINDYYVEVPHDISVSLARHDVGGDYDALIYRGIEICTMCSDDPEGMPYNGMFTVWWEDAEPTTVLTLDEAKTEIDTYFKLLPPRRYEQALSVERDWNDYTAALEADFDDDLGFSGVL